MVVHEPLRDVAHDAQAELGGEDARVLTLVLLQDVRLHRAAHAGERRGTQPRRLALLGRPAVLALEARQALVDGGVEEHGENGRRRAVDRHRHGGPGRAQIEALVKRLHIVQRRDGDPGVAYLTVDVGALIRIEPVQGDRIEGSGEARRIGVGREQLEAPVGSTCVALAREHARGLLALALERKHARGVGEVAGQVLLAQPLEQRALIGIGGQRDPRQRGAGERGEAKRLALLLGLHPRDQILCRVTLTHAGPGVEQRAAPCIEDRVARGEQRGNVVGFLARCLEHFQDLAKLLALPRDPDLLEGRAVVVAHTLGDLGEIARARDRYDAVAVRRNAPLDGGEPARGIVGEIHGAQRASDSVVQRRHPVVVETRCNRAVHRQRFERLGEGRGVALQLLAHVTQRVARAAPVELVDGDQIGEVEHVDLLELARRTELRGHDVERQICKLGNRGVALTDAGSFHDDDVDSRRLDGVNHDPQVGRQLGAGRAGCKRAHINLGMIDGVHADAVAEQGAAVPAPRRVHGYHRNARLACTIEAEAAHQLVAKRRLSRPAGAGDADDRRTSLLRQRLQLAGQRRGRPPVRDRGDDPCQRTLVAGLQGLEVQPRNGLRGCRALEHVVDHALEPHLLAVLGAVDARHAARVQLVDLARHDHAAPTAENPDVGAAALAQHVEHVTEKLLVPALVGAHRNGVGVFLDGGAHDLADRAVVAQMHHLRTRA